MKQLFDFILEGSELQELKDYILIELEKVQDKDILGEIRSILLSHNMNPEVVVNYFDKRHLNNCDKIIVSKFNSFADIEALQLLISQNGSDITSVDFLNAPNKDFYIVFGDVCKEKTLAALYELNLPNENNVARGKLEVLLNTILKDIDENGHGDVPTTMSGTIEIKGDGGMIKGQASYNIGSCTHKFNSIFQKIEDADDIFQKQGSFDQLIESLREHYTNEEILNGIIESYLAKYPLNDISDSDLSIIRSQFQQYLFDNQNQIFKSKVSSKVIWDAFLVTDFKFYQLLDKWDNLVVFNKKGKYSTFNAENDIKTTYDNVLKNLKSNGVTRLTSSIKIRDGRYQAIKVAKK